MPHAQQPFEHSLECPGNVLITPLVGLFILPSKLKGSGHGGKKAKNQKRVGQEPLAP
jgi:hypothetical protein